MITRFFENSLGLGKRFIKEVGDITLFGWDSIRLVFKKPFRYLELIRHMEFVGNQSLGIVGLTGLFTGLAISFQLYLGFKIFNAVNMQH